jgi:hypothetical protein
LTGRKPARTNTLTRVARKPSLPNLLRSRASTPKKKTAPNQFEHLIIKHLTKNSQFLRYRFHAIKVGLHFGEHQFSMCGLGITGFDFD